MLYRPARCGVIHWAPWRPRRAARFGAHLSGIRPNGALPPPCSTARSLTFGQAGHICRGCMQACARPRQRRANNTSSPTPSVIATVVALPRAGMTRGAVVVLSLPALHPSSAPSFTFLLRPHRASLTRPRPPAPFAGTFLKPPPPCRARGAAGPSVVQPGALACRTWRTRDFGARGGCQTSAPKRAALRGRHGAQWITWLNESQGGRLAGHDVHEPEVPRQGCDRAEGGQDQVVRAPPPLRPGPVPCSGHLG